MNFTSQICTTKEQSERLLALGLKKETADYCYEYKPKHLADTNNDWIIRTHSPVGTDFPAWSLHRLIEIMPSFIDIGEHTYMFSIMQGKLFCYYSDIVGSALLYGKGSVYDSAIYTIEWLIGEGYFNQEYLK